MCNFIWIVNNSPPPPHKYVFHPLKIFATLRKYETTLYFIANMSVYVVGFQFSAPASHLCAHADWGRSGPTGAELFNCATLATSTGDSALARVNQASSSSSPSPSLSSSSLGFSCLVSQLPKLWFHSPYRIKYLTINYKSINIHINLFVSRQLFVLVNLKVKSIDLWRHTIK